MEEFYPEFWQHRTHDNDLRELGLAAEARDEVE